MMEYRKQFIDFVIAMNSQDLSAKYEATPRYWSSGGQAEVDFVIQRENEIIPASFYDIFTWHIKRWVMI